MTEKRDTRSVLRRELRQANETYFHAITSWQWSGENAGQINQRAKEVAAASLRLHLFEQGRRSARR
jgi:hypothetical protein